MEDKKIISPYSMNQHTKNQLLRELLYGLNLEDLRKLLDLKKKMYTKPVPLPRTKTVKQMTQEYEKNVIAPPLEFRDGYKPVPLPRTKTVKQMAQEYEDNIIQPPLEFRDDYKPIPLLRTKKTVKPSPAPRTIIEETDKVLKGYTSSYKISIKHSTDPLLQLQNTRKAVEYHIKKALSAMKGLKFIETLKVTFSKAMDDGLIYVSLFQ